MTLFWITLIPFVVLFLLLIPLRRPAAQAAPVAYACAVAIALFVWQMTGTVVVASLFNTLIVFVELMLIVIFALLVLNVMIETGALDLIKTAIRGITKDKRVLAMLLAWALVGFIEGIAGFGTPAVLAAPVLVYFGVKPLKAVAICLIGNSTAVPFGAAGTPVVIGFEGLQIPEQSIVDAVRYTASIHTLMSMFITCSIAYIISADKPKGSFRSFVPFAIFSALAFSLPYLAIATFVGPEAPSIIGGITALVAIAYAAKRGFLLPSLPEELRISESGAARTEDAAVRVTRKNMLRSLAPFLVMSLALILSRTIVGARDVLQGITIQFGSFGGTELEALSPLYTPYAYLALALITALVTFRMDRAKLRQVATSTYERVGTTAIVLLFIIGLTQLLLISDMNEADLPAIPAVLGQGFADLLGGAFVIFSGFLGAIGAFMTGSATVSTLLFGGLQIDAARALERPFAIFLALQLIGASVGNLISLSNIAMAASAAGVESKEGAVIRETIIPVVVVCLVAGLILFFW